MEKCVNTTSINYYQNTGGRARERFRDPYAKKKPGVMGLSIVNESIHMYVHTLLLANVYRELHFLVR